MVWTQADRRKHRRYKVNQTCRITIGRGYFIGGGEVKGLITEISKGGFAVVFSPHKTWDRQLAAKLDRLLIDENEET